MKTYITVVTFGPGGQAFVLCKTPKRNSVDENHFGNRTNAYRTEAKKACMDAVRKLRELADWAEKRAKQGKLNPTKKAE